MYVASSTVVEDVEGIGKPTPVGPAPAPTTETDPDPAQTTETGPDPTPTAELGPDPALTMKTRKPSIDASAPRLEAKTICQEGTDPSTDPTRGSPQSPRRPQSPSLGGENDDHASDAMVDPDVPMMSLSVRRPRKKRKTMKSPASVAGEPEENVNDGDSS